MSTLKVTNINSLTATTPPVINDSAGTQIGTFCRAWVNFNGTGTVAIRASFNVSSITDNGTGDYTVNLATTMVDANYAVTTSNYPGASSTDYGLVALVNYQTAQTTSAFRVAFKGTAGGAMVDPLYFQAAIFR